MAKKKNFYYVLILTNDGPVFVTKVNNTDKTAEWNRNEKPLELDKYWAEDLQFGLLVNFYQAFTVRMPYELDTQPYMYSKGHFEWTWNEKEDK